MPCSRYFVSGHVLQEHSKTKAHKRRVKSLVGDKPHTQKDASEPSEAWHCSKLRASAHQHVMQGVTTCDVWCPLLASLLIRLSQAARV